MFLVKELKLLSGITKHEWTPILSLDIEVWYSITMYSIFTISMQITVAWKLDNVIFYDLLMTLHFKQQLWKYHAHAFIQKKIRLN